MARRRLLTAPLRQQVMEQLLTLVRHNETGKNVPILIKNNDIMKCYKYFLSCILLLMSTFVYSQGTFQVIESNGQYTYIEQPGPNLHPIDRHTPGIILSIPRGIVTVKYCNDHILVYPRGQYIRIDYHVVDYLPNREPPVFTSPRISSVRDFDYVTEDYKTGRGRSWFYCSFEGEYATLYVVVRKRNVQKFLAPIIGDDMAARFARSAKFKEEFPKDRGKYYTSEQDHPGKKFSRKYIVHQ